MTIIEKYRTWLVENSDNTNVNKLRGHIENGDHEKAKELLKNHHIYFHHSADSQHSRHQYGLVPHEHGEKFDLNNQSHINTLNSSAYSGGEWREANGVKPTGLKPPRRKGFLSRLLSR